MLRLCILALLTAFLAVSVGKPVLAATKKKMTYAECIADVQKKGYSSRAAASWCTQHGY
jgi:hypothetical protein